MRRVFQLIFLAIILLLIFSACRVRKNPLRMEIDQGGIYETFIDTSAYIFGNLLNEPYGRTVLTYLPPGFGEDTTYNYPVLFLLHGLKEKGWFYTHFYNIKSIADQMISSGEIQPMIIVMPDGSGKFGGSFFSNSVTPNGKNFAGKYEDYITKELFNKVLYDYGQWMRGIRYITTKMDSLVTRDSTVIDTTGCLIDTLSIEDCPPESLVTDTTEYLLIDTVRWVDTTITLSEDTAFFSRNFGISGQANGGYGALRIATDYPLYYGSASAMSAPLDFEAFEDLIPAFLDSNGVDQNGNGYHQINPDPKTLDRLSSFFFSMAVAFSPHDLTNNDTTTFFRLVASSQKIGVDLPFDSLGDTVSVIWQRWKNNDLKTRISNIPENNLKNLKIYIDCGVDDEFGFDQQALDFYNALPATLRANTALEFYSGYTGYLALNNSFIYDRLRKVLKFHSDCFSAP
jgi:S-formylglutathione hydrolase FrmB